MKINEIIRRFSMKWIALDEIHYTDNHGKQRIWEACSRTGNANAVCIIAFLKPSDRMVLVRQFRPAAGKLILEFPAGLIDPGEEPSVTAVRELREETGFTGTLDQLSEPSYSSCGITPETIRLAFMTIDEAQQADRQTDFDDGEDIETLLIPRKELCEFVLQEIRNGNGVDSKLMTWVLHSTLFNKA